MAESVDRWLEAFAAVEAESFDGETWPLVRGESTSWDVFGVSDVHADFGENASWVKSLRRGSRKRCLIVAGDVATKVETIQETLVAFQSIFDAVFYTPGNHESWFIGRGGDGYEPAAWAYNATIGLPQGTRSTLLKLVAIADICRKINVFTTPAMLTPKLGICPLWSWYREPNRTSPPSVQESGFDTGCAWPAALGAATNFDGAVADFFVEVNRKRVRTAPKEDVITFSHFLPRHDCYTGWSHLDKVMACPRIDDQLRAMNSHLHLCGHSHIAFDLLKDGVRYVQAPLGYPHERRFSSAASSLPKLLLSVG